MMTRTLACCGGHTRHGAVPWLILAVLAIAVLALIATTGAGLILWALGALAGNPAWTALGSAIMKVVLIPWLSVLVIMFP